MHFPCIAFPAVHFLGNGVVISCWNCSYTYIYMHNTYKYLHILPYTCKYCVLCEYILVFFSYSTICQWHWLGVHHIQRPHPHWHGPAAQRHMQPRERQARFTNHLFYRCPGAHVPACDNERGCVKLDYTTCLPIAWGHGNQIFRSKEADLQVLEFHFSVFFTGCRIGQESLTGLKHGAKCSSPSSQLDIIG